MASKTRKTVKKPLRPSAAVVAEKRKREARNKARREQRARRATVAAALQLGNPAASAGASPMVNREESLRTTIADQDALELGVVALVRHHHGAETANALRDAIERGDHWRVEQQPHGIGVTVHLGESARALNSSSSRWSWGHDDGPRDHSAGSDLQVRAYDAAGKAIEGCSAAAAAAIDFSAGVSSRAMKFDVAPSFDGGPPKGALGLVDVLQARIGQIGDAVARLEKAMAPALRDVNVGDSAGGPVRAAYCAPDAGSLLSQLDNTEEQLTHLLRRVDGLTARVELGA